MMLRRVLVLLCALACGAGLPARAEPVRIGTMTLDLPEGFDRKPASDGMVLRRRDLPRRDRPGARPGHAVIVVKAPQAATQPFDAAFAAYPIVEQLRTERSPLKGEGTTVNGHRIRWERRCCGRTGPRILAWTVGIGTPASHHFLQLVTMGATREEEDAVLAVFQGLVRSLRPAASDRAFALEPAGGGLEGLYTHLDSGLRLNPLGGMDFYSEQDTLLFDPSGLYSQDLPRDGDLAGTCRRQPARCGTYRVAGDQIRLTEVADGFGTLHEQSKSFTRKDGGIAIDDRDYFRIPPAKGPFDGTWNASFAQVGSGGAVSTSVFSARTLTLTRDGRFTRTGSSGFTSSNSTGDSTTGVSGSSRRPVESGRYAIAGYTLTLTTDDGRTEMSSLFAPDVGSDGLLVINGGNYLKAKPPDRPRAPR